MGVSGGTTAPRRRKQIREALGPSQPRGPRGKSEIPPFGSVPPMRFPQARPQRPQGAREGAAVHAPVDLGQQLQSRVKSGAIDQTQAQKTARQRLLLKKAFGSDWRSKVFAGSGVKEIREGGPFANRQVAAERAKGLTRAKRRLS